MPAKIKIIYFQIQRMARSTENLTVSEKKFTNYKLQQQARLLQMQELIKTVVDTIQFRTSCLLDE